MPQEPQFYIYVVVSRTDTVLGRLIRRSLHVEYNHCSLALDGSLDTIYSFGRKELRSVFRAGFVTEGRADGFFGVHRRSDISVVRLPVTPAQLARLREAIAAFHLHRALYKYSLLGLWYCYLGIPKKRENRYFCSQFVAEVLSEAGLSLFDKPETLVRPHDFLALPGGTVVYRGEIGRYAAAGAQI